MSVPPTSSSSSAAADTTATAGGVNVQRLLRDFYLSQISKAQRSVAIAKARMEALRSAIEAAKDALTEVSSLLVKVPETSNNAKFRDYAGKSPEELQRTQAALAKYQLVIGTLLYPRAGTLGTSSRTEGGRPRSYYDPPFTGVQLPDFSHLMTQDIMGIWQRVPPDQVNPLHILSSQISVNGGNVTPRLLDESKSDGASISKTVKILQAEIEALNQAFQMESSDAASALSTENSIREGSKSAMDRSFRVLGDTLGLRA